VNDLTADRDDFGRQRRAVAHLQGEPVTDRQMAGQAENLDGKRRHGGDVTDELGGCHGGKGTARGGEFTQRHACY
jgi:hypothetical protein